MIWNPYFAPSAFFLPEKAAYFFWKRSTRPVVSTNFIFPVKKGWQAEQISTVIAFLVLRVVNLLPQPQVTVASVYSGWMFFFMTPSTFGKTKSYRQCGGFTSLAKTIEMTGFPAMETTGQSERRHIP